MPLRSSWQGLPIQQLKQWCGRIRIFEANAAMPRGIADETMNRRSFHKRAAGLLTLSWAWAVFPFPTEATENDKVDEASELAMELGYKHNAGRVDTSAFPKRAQPDAQNQFCRTCQFFTGTPEAEWGQCVVFSGALVNQNGWCSSWFERAT